MSFPGLAGTHIYGSTNDWNWGALLPGNCRTRNDRLQLEQTFSVGNPNGVSWSRAAGGIWDIAAIQWRPSNDRL